MSYLHIFKDQRKETWHLKDSYSDSLHRIVDLDNKAIISILGNQLAGRQIDVSGQLGRQLMALAKKFWKSHDKKEGLAVGKWSRVRVSSHTAVASNHPLPVPDLFPLN